MVDSHKIKFNETKYKKKMSVGSKAQWKKWSYGFRKMSEKTVVLGSKSLKRVTLLTIKTI